MTLHPCLGTNCWRRLHGLQGLRCLFTKYNVLLIFDEIVTVFRVD